eukprot:TRINITY_DN10172_c0_g1_i1.p2 TRINITY_DN10172_c0_g1~~TRINITY_DN10172_c0_g1_i1.p2  ORF type:complete len:185 (+),score=88.77 TRINITY_DN10172_c0_g1_i1:121-675(+)
MPARARKGAGKVAKKQQAAAEPEPYVTWEEGTTVNFLQFLALVGLSVVAVFFYVEHKSQFPDVHVGDRVALVQELTAFGDAPLTFPVGTVGEVVSFPADIIPEFANIQLLGEEYTIPLQKLKKAPDGAPLTTSLPKRAAAKAGGAAEGGGGAEQQQQQRTQEQPEDEDEADAPQEKPSAGAAAA